MSADPARPLPAEDATNGRGRQLMAELEHLRSLRDASHLRRQRQRRLDARAGERVRALAEQILPLLHQDLPHVVALRRAALIGGDDPEEMRRIARQMLDQMPHDPQAADHRRTLEQATRPGSPEMASWDAARHRPIDTGRPMPEASRHRVRSISSRGTHRDPTPAPTGAP